MVGAMTRDEIIFAAKNLSGANLRDAYLNGADLRGADLRGADLRDADLSDADLRGANLRDANLSDANISSSDLRGANLSGANLIGSDLRGVNLIGSDLRDADLRGANLSDAADLRGSDLRGSDLRGANLRGANLIGADIIGTCLDPTAPVPYPTRAECEEAGFEIKSHSDGDAAWGWRTKQSLCVGNTTYTAGWHMAPVFSVDRGTKCHPGIYLGPSLAWMEHYPGIPLVRCWAWRHEMVHAGDKFRAKRIYVVEE